MIGEMRLIFTTPITNSTDEEKARTDFQVTNSPLFAPVFSSANRLSTIYKIGFNYPVSQLQIQFLSDLTLCHVR